MLVVIRFQLLLLFHIHIYLAIEFCLSDMIMFVERWISQGTVLVEFLFLLLLLLP